MSVLSYNQVMQFQVPQFIEVEDKIFGPLTLKQFIYLAGGVGLSMVLYFLLPIFIAIPLILPVAGLSLALAFYKINSKPFIDMLESAFNYYLGHKLYLWKKLPKMVTEKRQMEEAEALITPRLSDSKLKELAWSLDVKEKLRK